MPISRKAASRRMPAHFGRPALLALFAGVICLISVPLPLRAAGSELVGGSVSPGHGTTATSFVFIVDYTSGPARDAQSVRAEIEDADMTLDLALIASDAAGGTWRASSPLPVGTWTVTFRAVAIGLDPTLRLTDAVVVTQVTSPPTPPPTQAPPTQAPTPRPSPRPSPRPQPTVPPTLRPPVPTAQPTGQPGSTVTSPAPLAPIASQTAGTSGGGASPVSSSTLAASASAGASLAASPVVVARRPDATPAGATPGAEPADAATPTPEATDATSASASISRNAWLLLGGSLAVLGTAILARQRLRGRSRPSTEG
ncbi:MAG: hypothetical protein ABI534_05570 [Chloroflexota bacterium]